MSDFVFQSRILLLFFSFLFVHQRHIFHYKELWELLRSGAILASSYNPYITGQKNRRLSPAVRSCFFYYKYPSLSALRT